MSAAPGFRQLVDIYIFSLGIRLQIRQNLKESVQGYTVKARHFPDIPALMHCPATKPPPISEKSGYRPPPDPRFPLHRPPPAHRKRVIYFCRANCAAHFV
jgi:hypothetical protein